MNSREMFGEDNAARMKFQDRTMPCKRCGTIMHMGTGDFPTDYKCGRCDTMFNSAGSEVRSISESSDCEESEYCGGGEE
jgi:hypothetical protein